MGHEVTCNKCHSLLRVDADVGTTAVTCPRCLARVANPVVLVQSEPPERPALTPEKTECPSCGKPIESDWRYCPFCDELLHRPRHQQPTLETDAEVQFDMAILGGGLVGLGFLGTCALFAFLINGWAIARGEVVMGIIGGLFLIVMVGVGFALGGKNAAASGTVGMLGGLTLMLIILGLPFALCLGFLNSCSGPHALLLWLILTAYAARQPHF